MTLEQYAFVAQIVGVIIVVVTLVYLAVQTKQNTDAIKANSRHTIIASDMQLLALGIANPAIDHCMYKKELTDDEKVQLEWWLVGLCRTREHQWLQYDSGLLDKKAWETYRSALRRNLLFKRTNAWWKSVGHVVFDRGFVADVDQYLARYAVIDDWNHAFGRIDAAQ